MKHIKKIAVLVLALVMLTALAAPAFAAGPGSITVNNPTATHTYAAYKVFDVTYSGSNYAYTIDSGSPWFAAVSAFAGVSGNGLTLTRVNNSTTYNVSFDSDDFRASELADALNDVTRTGITANASVTAADTDPITLNNLPIGYYFVTSTLGTVCNLTTTNLDVVIYDKNETPVLTKAIAPGVNLNNLSIGDTVPFTLSTKVPDMTGYNLYYFVINDTMSKGLTFDATSVVVKIDGTTLAASAYTVETTTNADGSTTVRVIFHNFLQYSSNTGDAVVVTYNATLNDAAVIGGANTNVANLTYSNNPAYDYDGNKGTGVGENPYDPKDSTDPNAPVGETPLSTTETFTTSLTITKKDPDGEVLTGASFRITGDGVNMVVTTGDVYVVNAAGTYYKLDDGTYSTTAPDGYTGVRYAKETKVTINTDGSTVFAEAFVGADGTLTFSGLGAGTYTITETVVPDGYNGIDPINLVISFNAGTKTFTATANGTAIDVTGNALFMDVVNQTGTVLPETGGIGTTIFYVLGAALVLSAVVLLVVKKRMSHEQ